ncbi:histidine kinase-like protein [Streptomyces sp. 840.1]|uniref:ATP-binding protein n=1 Tax=Streptomyces sp. 840.1 TaxID=2485152 RepID=UPI000F483BEC|nr:ATP-binding protein [Streptomyces sp. 840.1]ROQ66891.1 histidine kinase-like protein [Streptomyces sp. 840.1]
MTPVSVPPAPAPYLPQRGERYRLVAPNTPTAPRIARDFVGALLRTTEHPGLADDARLCVSEVVSNAHCHTRSARIRVDVTVNRRQVMVYVTDDEPARLPKPGVAPHVPHTPYAPHAESGRGLVIVESLTDRWGTTTRGGRVRTAKTVWFVLVERAAVVGARS